MLKILCWALLFIGVSGLRLTETRKGLDKSDRIAVFTTATDTPEYLKKVITTFALVKDMNKGQKVDVIVAGPYVNPESIKLLKDHDMEMMFLNVTGFKDSCNTKGCWPGVMHWWAAVPELLADKGYKYSVFIDGGDVIAYRPLTIEAVQETLANEGTMGYKVTSTGQVNSGVITFDNVKAKEQGLAREYLQFYQKHQDDKYIKGKDGEKDLAFSLSGRKGDADFLRLLIRSIEAPPQIKFNRMGGTSFGMICRRGKVNKIPYFVHLSNCHGHVPETDQKGIPFKASQMWAKKSEDLFGQVLGYDNNAKEKGKKSPLQPMSLLQQEEEEHDHDMSGRGDERAHR